MAVKGAKTQTISPSRGSQTTKILVPTDVLGHPAVIRLTPDNVSDIRIATELIEAVGPVLIADRGYDVNHIRCALRAEGTILLILERRSCKRPIRHDVLRYRERWRIEAASCRLKDFRRVATRYDKPTLNFLSAVVLAAIIAFWISMSPEPRNTPFSNKTHAPRIWVPCCKRETIAQTRSHGLLQQRGKPNWQQSGVAPNVFRAAPGVPSENV